MVVTDFGLAKESELAPSVSQSGSIIGTPSYMAPEQAIGSRGAVDARTDVYGLGATIYDQLAGRPPFVDESLIEVLRQVVEDEPAPLVTLARGLDRDLATIAHKCLAKRPEQRYASALALAGDLDSWLSGEVILARPASVLYRLRRFLAKRQGILVAATAAAVLALLAVAPFWMRARERRASAERAPVVADTGGGALDHADSLRAGGRPREAEAVLDRAMSDALEFAAHADVGRASLFLGRLHAAQGRMEDAVRAFDRALDLDPDLPEARFERGMARGVLWRQGTRPGEPLSPSMDALRAAAIADISAAPPRDGAWSKSTMWGIGLLAWLQDEHELAERFCQDVVELDPSQVEAWLVMARIAVEAGDEDRAMFLSARAVDAMSGTRPNNHERLQVGSEAIEAAWIRLPRRRERILDLRKVATTTPSVTFASGALALESLEAGARALDEGDSAAALRELESAEYELTRAMDAADADPLFLSVRGVCALLRDEAMTGLDRADEAAEALNAAARDFAAASLLGANDVRVASWWNQSLLAERKIRIAKLAGNTTAAESAREEAASSRGRAMAAAVPGSDLAALLRSGLGHE